MLKQLCFERVQVAVVRDDQIRARADQALALPFVDPAAVMLVRRDADGKAACLQDNGLWQVSLRAGTP